MFRDARAQGRSTLLDYNSPRTRAELVFAETFRTCGLDEQRVSLGRALAQLVQSLSLPGLSTPQGYQAQLLYAALKVPSPQHVFAVGESVVIACWGLHEEADSGFDPFGPMPLSERVPTVGRLGGHAPIWIGSALLIIMLFGGSYFWDAREQKATTISRSTSKYAPGYVDSPVIEPRSLTPIPSAPSTQELTLIPRAGEELPTAPREKSQPSRPPQRDQFMPVPTPDQVASLQGCWQTDTYIYVGGEAGVSKYCFDARGQGELTHTERRVTCRAAAHIEFGAPAAMVLVDSDSRCSDGSMWLKDELRCHADETLAAICEGHSGDGRRWSTRLHRL
jgi:hypothetical protein